MRLGWHPYLRINGGGTFRPQGRRHYESFREIVKQLGGYGSVRGVAFQGKHRLPCTHKGHLYGHIHPAALLQILCHPLSCQGGDVGPTEGAPT